MKLKKIYLIICLISIFSFLLTCSSCDKEQEDIINLEELWYENKPRVLEYFNRIGFVNPIYVSKSRMDKQMDKQTYNSLKNTFGVELKGLLLWGEQNDELGKVVFEFYSHKDAVTAFANGYKGNSDSFVLVNNLIILDIGAVYILLDSEDVEEIPNQYVLSKDLKKLYFCDLELKELKMPASITEITGAACYYSSLESVVLGENVTKIGISAFEACKNLKKVTLNSTLEKICLGAFYGCENLKSIVIPKGVKFIGKIAFTQGNIYCEQSSKPEEWHPEFAVENAKVYWAGEWEYDKDGNPQPIVNGTTDSKN